LRAASPDAEAPRAAGASGTKIRSRLFTKYVALFVAVVAVALGVSTRAIWYARSQGVFSERLLSGLGGKRGKPVPLISNGGKLLDPGAGNFYARPHPIWGGAWEFLSRLIPEDFEQTVLRRPFFIKYRNADDPKLRGYRWVCPMCKKEVRTIYYPVPVRTLFDCWFTDPVIQKRLCDADMVQTPPGTFACVRCHEIYYFCSIIPDAWNRVIAYVTGGMLYGREVQKPGSLVAERKRTRTRMLNREAPVRRKVLARLRNGWSDFEIARDLGLSMAGVVMHILRIRREERVADRRELAEKLKFAVAPPFAVCGPWAEI